MYVDTQEQIRGFQ